MSDDPTGDIVFEIADPQWWYYAATTLDVIRRSNIRITSVLTTAQPQQTYIATRSGIIILDRIENSTKFTIMHYGDTRTEWEEIAGRIRQFAEAAQSIRRSGKPTADEVIERYYRIRAAGRKASLRRLAEETGFSYSYLRDTKVAYDKRGGWGSKKKMPDTPEDREA